MFSLLILQALVMLTTEETLSSILPAFHIRRSVKSHCGQSGPTSEHPNGKWNLIKKILVKTVRKSICHFRSKVLVLEENIQPGSRVHTTLW